MKKQKTKYVQIRGTKQHMDPLIANIVIFLSVLVAADLFVILHFQKHDAKPPKEPIKQELAEIVAEEYTNPEAGKIKSLKVGGEFDRKMPVFPDKLKFKITYDPALAGPNDLHVLSVCCPAGYSREFYTAKMPWAFLLYEFEPGVPTIVLFELKRNTKTGRYEIVILDKRSDATAIRAVTVTIFEELLKQYLPGYTWTANVRKELM
jgi:hypothetical protein